MRIIFQKLLKKPALTFEMQNDILGKYFGNALSGGLRRGPQSDNRTDERHRGSQLKVPKETGTSSRKMVRRCFLVAKTQSDLSISRVQVPVHGKDSVC